MGTSTFDVLAVFFLLSSHWSFFKISIANSHCPACWTATLTHLLASPDCTYVFISAQFCLRSTGVLNSWQWYHTTRFIRFLTFLTQHYTLKGHSCCCYRTSWLFLTTVNQYSTVRTQSFHWAIPSRGECLYGLHLPDPANNPRWTLYLGPHGPVRELLGTIDSELVSWVGRTLTFWISWKWVLFPF